MYYGQQPSSTQSNAKKPIPFYNPQQNKITPNQKILIGSLIALGLYTQGSPKVKKIIKSSATIVAVGIGLTLANLYR